MKMLKKPRRHQTMNLIQQMKISQLIKRNFKSCFKKHNIKGTINFI